MIETLKKALKRMLKLSLSEDEQRVLDALNKSNVKSRRVVGRGTLITLDLTEITESKEFKSYLEQGARIVERHRQA